MGSRLVIPASGVPIGSIHYFGAITPPKGFLIADGSLLLRATYAKLFAVIGTAFGAGNGSTTFALPDLRGEFIRGLDAGRGVDTGRGIGSAQADLARAHSHNFSGTTSVDGNHTHNVTRYQNWGYANGIGQATDLNGATNHATSAAGNHSHSFSGTTNAVGGSETRPRNIALLACIKY